MDWRLLATTFVAVFLAEMGDKTQLATMAFASSGSRWAVFAGSAAALVCASAIAVLAGELVARHVSPLWIRRAAGALFVVLGLVFLLGRGEPSAPAPSGSDPEGTSGEGLGDEPGER